MIDNYEIWKAHEDEMERRLAELPLCVDCGNHVQDEHYYWINDEVICPRCLEDGYRRYVEDYIA